MNLIKCFSPNVTIRRIQTSEKTEDGKTDHEFICFDAKDVVVSNAFEAKMLAKKMGQKVFQPLKKLMKIAKNEKQVSTILKTKAWVYKKAGWHPALVEQCTHKVLQKMKKDAALKEIPLTYKEIYNDASVCALLHDIGRLSEADLAQGCVMMEKNGLNKNHAVIGFDILEHAQIKPEILLAIKYHLYADIKEAVRDALYKKLGTDNKKISEFYIRLLQDMDKTANLLERSKFGIKRCAEFFNTRYRQDYGITEEYFQKALTGKYLPLKGKGHLLDVAVHCVTWVYQTHFIETKEVLSDFLDDFFWQIYAETQREYDVSEIKNPQKLIDTLKKIMQLEDYTMTEQMNMKVNLKNRQKIVRQIANCGEKCH